MFNTINEALEDIRNGKPVIIVDDENRENEGDGGKAFGDEFLPWK